MKKVISIFLAVFLLAGVSPFALATDEVTWIDLDLPYTVGTFYDGLAMITNNNMIGANSKILHGFININGEVGIPCKYEGVFEPEFRCGYAPVKKDGLYGLFDNTGKMVIPCSYDSVSSAITGYEITRANGMLTEYRGPSNPYPPALFRVCKDGKDCYFNGEGNQVSAWYDSVDTEIHDGMMLVTTYVDAGEYSSARLKEQFGFVNMEGKEVVPCIYPKAERFKEGMALVMNSSGLYGFVDTTGELAIPCTLKRADSFCNGFATFVGESGVGFINKKGEVVIPAVYMEVDDFYEGLCAVKNTENKWGCIDTKGNTVIPFDYEEISACFGGVICAKKDGKWGMIDTEESIIVPFEGADTLFNSELLGVIVFPDSSWRNVDKRGRYVIKDIFSAVGGDECQSPGGLIPAQVIVDESNHVKFGLARRSDYAIVTPLYDNINMVICQEGLLSVKNGDKYGALDRWGNVVIPIEYDKLSVSNDGLLTVEKDGRMGVIKNPVLSISDWAVSDVNKAQTLGLVPVYMDSYFQKELTRMQLSALAVNLIETILGEELTPAGVNRFTDTTDTPALKAARAGLVSGTGDGTTFSPDSYVTREQIATILYRTIKYIETHTGEEILNTDAELTEYSDTDKVSEWAENAVSILTANKIMKGTSTTTFSPQNNTSVEQGIILMLRTCQLANGTGA